MFKQCSNLLSEPVKQGNKVSLWRHPENRGEDAAEGTATFETYLGQRPGRRP